MQDSIDWILGLRHDAATNQVSGQQRYHHDCENCRCTHRVTAGECQRFEQAPFLGFQCKNRKVRNDDHQQRKEQGGTDLARRRTDSLPALTLAQYVTKLSSRLSQMFVCVLDKHNWPIDHRTNRDCNSSKRHDVGIDPLQAHGYERHEDANRKRNNSYHRRAQVQEKHRANDRYQPELQDQCP